MHGGDELAKLDAAERMRWAGSWLARGSARYEKDPNVTVQYIAKARLAAEAARSELAAIAAAEGIDLGSTKSPK